MQQDIAQAHAELDNTPCDYGFPLRPYQEQAIRAVEAAICEGQRAILLAMATGTGKTKTCIALIYRLLKAKRFRRILFLVDRSALGEQAANAFKDTRMEKLQTFADIFGIKELEHLQPDGDTAVHIATVQGMVQRVLYAPEDAEPPSIDQYDCIVVDECHRGYLLDRELSETELSFRGYDDYISKYRRILDYFDAVKVGLTATPALHTTQIFGPPAFTYSYREAVIDGYLVDYEPPVQIHTSYVKLEPLLKRCDLAISSGPGIGSACLLAGVPMLVLPNHIEQMLFAESLVRTGMGLALSLNAIPMHFAAVLDRLLSDPRFAQRAQAMARKYKSYDQDKSVERIANTIERLPGHVAGRKRHDAGNEPVNDGQIRIAPSPLGASSPPKSEKQILH